LVPVNVEGEPLARARMYNDPCEDSALLSAIDAAAPAESAARGPTSGLARAALFLKLKPAKILHQADWIAFRFSGRFVSDANNALKTGYDPVALAWPAWIERAGVDAALLPDVVAPGVSVGTIAPASARAFGLPADVCVAAGTTDGCASFLATGASSVGDGVTALGTSLTLKLLSDKRRRGASGAFLTGRDRSPHAGHRPGRRHRARLLSPDPQGRAVSDRRSGLAAAHGAASQESRKIPAGDPRRNRQHRGARLPKARRTRRAHPRLDAHGRRRGEESRLDAHPREKARRPVDRADLERSRIRRGVAGDARLGRMRRRADGVSGAGAIIRSEASAGAQALARRS